MSSSDTINLVMPQTIYSELDSDKPLGLRKHPKEFQVHKIISPTKMFGNDLVMIC